MMGYIRKRYTSEKRDISKKLKIEVFCIFCCKADFLQGRKLEFWIQHPKKHIEPLRKKLWEFCYELNTYWLDYREIRGVGVYSLLSGDWRARALRPTSSPCHTRQIWSAGADLCPGCAGPSRTSTRHHTPTPRPSATQPPTVTTS